MSQTEGSTFGALSHHTTARKGRDLWPMPEVANVSSLPGPEAMIWPSAALPAVTSRHIDKTNYQACRAENQAQPVGTSGTLRKPFGFRHAQFSNVAMKGS